MRYLPFLLVLAAFGLFLWGAQSWVWFYIPAGVFGLLGLIGIYDLHSTNLLVPGRDLDVC